VEDSEEAIRLMGDGAENEGFMVNAVIMGKGVNPAKLDRK